MSKPILWTYSQCVNAANSHQPMHENAITPAGHRPMGGINQWEASTNGRYQPMGGINQWEASTNGRHQPMGDINQWEPSTNGSHQPMGAELSSSYSRSAAYGIGSGYRRGLKLVLLLLSATIDHSIFDRAVLRTNWKCSSTLVLCTICTKSFLKRKLPLDL